MFDTSKLRGRIIEKFGTIGEFCRAAGTSRSYVSQYLNGQKMLSQGVMDKWIKTLEIAADEIQTYFFTPRVHEMEQ